MGISLRSLSVAFLISLACIGAYGATRSSSNSGAWTNSTNWGGSLPVTGDIVYAQHDLVIYNDTIFNYDQLTANGGSITVNGNLILSNNCDLILNRPMTVTGNFIMTSGASITINSGGALSIDGFFSSNSNTLTLTNNALFSVNGDFTMQGSSTLVNNGSGSMSVGGDFNFKSTSGSGSTNNGTINIAGSLNIENSGQTFTNNGGSTINVNKVVVSNSTNFLNWGTVNGDGELYSESTWNGNPPTGSLPVELIEFNAFMIDGDLKANWTTSSETNNLGFSVQISTDGVAFEESLFVEGYGTTSEKQHYETSIYTKSIASIYYIRLIQYDYNGASSTKKTVAVKNDSEISFYPNLVSEGQTVFFGESYSEISFFNISGQQKDLKIEGGELQTERLGSGIWFVKSTNVFKKLIIQ